jgi:hypothetical protein
MLTYDEILHEISKTWEKLCFISPLLKEYVGSQADELIGRGSSRAIFELLSASLEFINGNKIYSQDALISAYLSNIKLEDSTISNLSVSENTVTIVSSTFEFNNMQVNNVTAVSQDFNFILIGFESTMEMHNIYYRDSNMILFNLGTSEASISNITFTNVTHARHLFETYDAYNITVSSIKATNCSIDSQSLLHFKESRNIVISNVELDRIIQPVILMDRSHFILIQGMKISNSRKVLIAKDSNIEVLKDSEFSGNGHSDNKGGVFELFNTLANLTNTTFVNNTASVGGAIHFDCSSVSNWGLSITNSTFQSNIASKQGGVLYYGFKHPKIDNWHYKNNSAPYGNELASYAVKIRLLNSSSDQMTVSNIGSGIAYHQNISFSLLDYDNQVLVTNSENDISISPINNSENSIVGSNSVLLSNGTGVFVSLTVIGKPGSKGIKFQMSSKAINTAKINQVYGEQVSSNTISLNFRNWQPGEVQYANNRWVECSARTFSLEWNSLSCQQCLENTYCPGKEAVSVDSGFWRMTANSTNIIKWINRDAWEGGFVPENEHPVDCKEGYTGHLCFECQYKKGNKFHRSGEAECAKCNSTVANFIQYIVMCILVFAFIMILVTINVRKTKESEVSILIRILMNYLQLISTVLSFAPAFPDSIYFFLYPTYQLGGASESLLSFDCMFPDYDVRLIFSTNRLLKVFLTAVLPIILTVIISVIWLIIYYSFPKYALELKRCLIITFVSTIFILYSKLAEQSISVFRWIELDDNVSRARIDTDIEWYSPDHVFWCVFLGLPVMIIWVVGAPVTALVLLYKNYKRGPDNKVNQYLLILYQGLEHNKFYWEFVNILRKILLLSMLLFEDIIKVAISWVILVGTARIQVAIKPYK